MLAMRSLVLSLVIAAVAAAGAMAEEPTAPHSVGIATHSHLNDATALANKNNVKISQNVAVARSNIRAQQDDVVGMVSDEKEQTTMAGRGASGDSGAQPNDVPAGLVLTGDRGTLKSGTEADDGENTTDKDKDKDELTFGGDQPPSDLTLTGESDMLTSPDASEGDAEEGEHELEQFIGYRRRFFFPRFRRGYYGWRYPLPYWRRFGRRFYGGRCPFGRIYGNFYYC